METVLIFTGGDTPSQGVVEDIPRPDLVLAADSGYDSALSLGYAVDVLVGDLDSISAAPLPDHVIVERHAADKDATDLELALDLAARETPDRVVIVGGSGGRLDHELGTAQLICSEKWAHIDEIDWLSDRAWAHVVRRRRIIHGDIGATLTLIPMGGDVAGLRTTGLKWNLDGETLTHGTTRGVSNVMHGPVADIRVGTGCLLVVLPAG